MRIALSVPYLVMNGLLPQKKKSVGVVCATYRDPQKPSIVREFGIVSLVEQMFSQDYKGDITLSIVDSSPTAHPYLEIISKRFPQKIIYNHIPNRDTAIKQKTKFDFVPDNQTIKNALILMALQMGSENQPVPKAIIEIASSEDLSSIESSKFDILIGREKTDDYLSQNDIDELKNKYSQKQIERDVNTVFWASRLKETKDIAGFVPFEEDYPIQANLFSQIFGARPTIGMKKNFGIQALVDKGFSPEAIVFSDDDDHHSPNYVAKSVAALGSNDFTRMTRYITHIFNASEDNKKHAWAKYDLQVRKDSNGYWRLDPRQQDQTKYNLHPDGHVYETKIGGKYSRLVTMAWPILGHEGALHTYSMDLWKRSVDSFGGCIPVSFGEDMIYYARLRGSFGKDFKSVHTPIVDGEEDFVRIADGGNASVIEWSELISQQAIPDWAANAVKPLYDALGKTDVERQEILKDRAQKLAL